MERDDGKKVSVCAFGKKFGHVSCLEVMLESSHDVARAAVLVTFFTVVVTVLSPEIVKGLARLL